MLFDIGKIIILYDYLVSYGLDSQPLQRLMSEASVRLDFQKGKLIGQWSKQLSLVLTNLEVNCDYPQLDQNYIIANQSPFQNL